MEIKAYTVHCLRSSIQFLEPNAHSEDDCFTKNTALPSNKVAGGFIKKIDSAKECQLKCQLIQTCKSFVYNKNARTCTFKTLYDIAKTKTKPGKIFGPKFCAGIAHVIDSQ